VIPELERRGHQLQFLHFHDEPATRPAVRTGPFTQLVDAGRIGERDALDRLRDFHPDLINVHGDIGAAFQSRLLRIAPAAYSVHNHYGTCISGLKTHRLPVIQPCHRRFGPACLLEYFPHRCGGLSPITMLRRYFNERRRLRVMSQYDAVIAHSRYMENEYVRHGLYPARVYGLPYEASFCGRSIPNSFPPPLKDSAHLIFAGRMERLKGGHVLLAALPEVQAVLGRPIELCMAGDGPDRPQLEKTARRTGARNPSIRIHFPGWVTGVVMERLFEKSHLLVVPSLCPEAFGKIGPEAAGHGVPAAAFDVGGIGEWLISGVNGIAAPSHPPTPAGLAQAICACLKDPEIHARLRQGALAGAGRFDLGTHVDRLVVLFEQICRGRKLRLTLSTTA
jgi:glycosyltransferase involved in cell wall biosynthesis